MIDIMVPGIFLLSGICAYGAVTHLAAGARRPLDRTHLLFAGMCALTALLGVANGLGYQATTVAEAARALKWSLGAATLFFVVFAWFVGEYTGVRPPQAEGEPDVYTSLATEQIVTLIMSRASQHPADLTALDEDCKRAFVVTA